MQLHANAALSLNGRRAMVMSVIDEGLSIAEAAERARVSEKTCRKWLSRWVAEGPDGLRDHSSAPKVVANKTPADRVQAIAALRRLRFTAEQIAEVLDMALSTVSGLLKDSGWAGSAGWASSQRFAMSASGPAS